jgi:transcriptional regulator with XRE-family HTH domain
MIAVGQLLRAARLARGLSREVVATRLGYRNIVKGVRRVAVAEATGAISEGLLARLLEVLGLDLAAFEQAVEEASHQD